MESENQNKLEKLPEESVDHFSFFILYLLTYFLAENIIFLTDRLIPEMYNLLTPIFGVLVISLVTVIYMSIIVRIITYALPSFNSQESPSWLISLVPIAILTHPILLSLDNQSLLVGWQVIDIIEAFGILTFILFFGIYLFFGVIIREIVARGTTVRSTPVGKYLNYLADDIFNLCIIILIFFYIIRSALVSGVGSLSFAFPLKLILVYLFSIFTAPITEE